MNKRTYWQPLTMENRNNGRVERQERYQRKCVSELRNLYNGRKLPIVVVRIKLDAPMYYYINFKPLILS